MATTTSGDDQKDTRVICPHCGREAESGASQCAECGQPLSSAPGRPRRRWPVLVAVVVVAAVVCLAGTAGLALLLNRGLPAAPLESPLPSESARPAPSATPSPSPSAGPSWQSYESSQLGVSLLYPQGWLLSEQPEANQVVFALTPEDLQVDMFLRGTRFTVMLNPSEAVGAETPDVVLDDVSGFLANNYQGLQSGEVLSVSIDGREGALVLVEGELTGPAVIVKAWVAATIAYENIYLFAAAAPVDFWPEYEVTFEDMLDSVRLSPPGVAAVIPSPTLQPTVAPPSPTIAPPAAAPTSVAPSPTIISGADAYEPDDDIAQAKPIATDGTPQAHNLDRRGDQDYVSFEAEDGFAYTIETFDLGEIDTIIFLYDAQGQELAHNDDGTDEPYASRITWVAPDTGIYYAMVRDLAGDSAGPEATYSLSVKESPFVEGADPFEPDDDLASARPIDTTGTHQAHTFHTSTDVDYVYFSAQGGKRYAIETGGLTGDCDTVIFLYDRDGVELDLNDDAGEEVLSSLLEWTAPSSGTYYVEVRDFGGHAGPEVGYQLWVTVR
jgi:ribosomal protein L37E